MNLITLLLAQSAFAADITVDASGTGDHTTVQAAVDAAVSGDVITVLAGMYTENILIESKSIDIQGADEDARDTTYIVGTGSGPVTTIVGGLVNMSNLTVSGGSQGIAITSNAVSTLTNLVVEDNVNDVNGGGVSVSGNADVVLNNLLIQNNTAAQGGGVYLAADAKKMQITDSTIRDNAATEAGGGIHTSAPFLLQGSWISDNNTDGNGGGVYATTIAPEVENSDFWGNSAANGGGIALDSASTISINANRVRASEFWLNSATESGGGIWINGSGPQYLKQDLFILNTAGGDGGGLWATGGQPNLTFIRAWHNEAGGDGGGAWLYGANGGKTRRSSFGGNIAGGIGGGAIHSESNGYHPVVSNRYIENQASEGAGLVIHGDALKRNIVANADIVGNTGGGIAFIESTSAKIENSIVAFNTETGISADEASAGPYFKLMYNNVHANDVNYGDQLTDMTGADVITGTNGNISADPAFVRFSIDGDPIGDFLYLSDTSPCIDEGRPEAGYIDTDGSPSDMGSYGGPDAESRDTDGARYDEDGDGYDPSTGDCDDGDELSAPGLEEVPGDGRDNDCSGGKDIDIDGDGVISPFDCDDTNADIYPGADDIPGDGVDADCDGSDGELPPDDDTGDDPPPTGSDTGAPWVDEDTGSSLDPYEDADRDGFTDVDDCDDSNADINPDAKEDCSDGMDNDCDGDSDAADSECGGTPDKGCGCAATSSHGQGWWSLLMVGLLIRRRKA